MGVLAVAFVVTTLLDGFWVYPLVAVVMVCTYAGAGLLIGYFHYRDARRSVILTAMLVFTITVDSVLALLTAHGLTVMFRSLVAICALVGAGLSIYELAFIRRQLRDSH